MPTHAPRDSYLTREGVRLFRDSAFCAGYSRNDQRGQRSGGSVGRRVEAGGVDARRGVAVAGAPPLFSAGRGLLSGKHAVECLDRVVVDRFFFADGSR